MLFETGNVVCEALSSTFVVVTYYFIYPVLLNTCQSTSVCVFNMYSTPICGRDYPKWEIRSE